MTLYFTADTHFFHHNVIEYSKRPFASVTEMNEKLIYNWNSTVTDGDVVYHLGDVSFGKKEETTEIIKRLKGEIHLIRGNHDGKRLDTGLFASCQDYKVLKIEQEYIVLSHYAMRVWDRSHYGSWMLHGHSHGSLNHEGQGKILDVGVDCFNFKPVSFTQLCSLFSTIPAVQKDHHRIEEGR